MRKLFLTVLSIIVALVATTVFVSCTEVVLSNDKEISAIEIVDLPDTVVKGEFDEVGGKLKVIYFDETYETVPFTSNMLSEKYQAMLNTVGSYTISVYYRGKSTSFEINVRSLETFVLTFKNAQGYTVRTKTFTEGEEQTVDYPTAEEMFVEGYRFVKFPELELPISEDTTITGEYVKTWKVSFYNALNGLIDRQIVDDGENATAPTADKYEMDGYDFITWDNTFKNVHADVSVYGIYASVSEGGKEPTSTDNSYFRFMPIGDEAYSIEPLNPDDLPEDIIIPATYNGKPVTEIAEMSFYGNKNIKSVYMPDSITEIYASAFYECSALESVRLSSGLTEIPDYAFYNCTSLTSCELPDGIETIGQYAFYYCKMTEVGFSSSVREIKNHAFENVKIENLYLPATIEKVETNAFAFAESKTAFLDAKEIQGSFFNATNITIGKNVKVLENLYGSSWSSDCRIVNIYADEENENYSSINGNLYSKEGTVLIQYAGAKTATDFIVPKGVAIILKNAFNGAEHLEAVNLSESVEELEQYSFRYCSNLTSINLNKVKKIANEAFSECNKLIKSIKGLNIVDTWVIKCVVNTVSLVTISDGITGIADWAFCNCGITSIVIPENVKYVGNFAFYGSKSLERATIGNGVASIGSSAFNNCTSLTIINIGNGVTNVGDDAFYGCPIEQAKTPLIAYPYIKNSNLNPIGLTIIAIDGKVFRRKSDGFIFGEEICLGYAYIIGGEVLPEPHLEVPEDFEEIDR